MLSIVYAISVLCSIVRRRSGWLRRNDSPYRLYAFHFISGRSHQLPSAAVACSLLYWHRQYR